MVSCFIKVSWTHFGANRTPPRSFHEKKNQCALIHVSCGALLVSCELDLLEV